MSDSSLQILIDLALKEDVKSGDVTSQALFGDGLISKEAFLVAKEEGVLAGLFVAQKVFQAVDPQIIFEELISDGQAFKTGQKIAKISGSLQSILTAERTALNFLQHLSGIASLTQKFVKAVSGTSVKILDTRKTLPAYRDLEKYAVKMGGGENHRQGLYDQYLIKDNHLMGRSITEALQLVKNHNHDGKKVEIEVYRLDQIEEVLKSGADIILLDNFSPTDLKKAIALVNCLASGRTQTEASGGINLQNVLEYAQTGVDRISIGALTHSAKALDIGLEIF
ncbi:MAG: carboxylating nicotinate-nucleotide diphosphorylase [Deltaproteobacteria bacterium]|nr:MAG: carboxylating nicotinate-nucleotide diphosphorylase [Deltaproteobacteria bacterium]